MEEEIKVDRMSFDDVVNMLLKAQDDGKKVFCKFKGHELHSEGLTVDSAYQQVFGVTKDKFDEIIKEWFEDRAKEIENSRMRKEHLAAEIANAYVDGKITEDDVHARFEELGIEEDPSFIPSLNEVKNDNAAVKENPSLITAVKVVAALKFMAEHPDCDQQTLLAAFEKLGCGFNFNDIKEQFPEPLPLLEGMRRGELAAGASIIVNSRDAYGRDMAKDKFLSLDDDISIYHFVRTVTGDESYTKENVDKLANKNNSNKITEENVIAGLKFLAENPDCDQHTLVNAFAKLGCDFKFSDIKEQFPEPLPLLEGMRKGELAAGASIIVNSRDEFGRAMTKDKFLSLDDDISIYHFVRTVTGDESYTKENVDSMERPKRL